MSDLRHDIQYVIDSLNTPEARYAFDRWRFVIRRLNAALGYDISAGLSFDDMEYFISEMRERLEKAMNAL
jgi:hypothetical protein